MVRVENGIVKIPYPENPETAYEFALDRAGEKFADTNESDWIRHMAQKTWTTMPMLIELTNILKKEAPDLDWEKSLSYAQLVKNQIS